MITEVYKTKSAIRRINGPMLMVSLVEIRAAEAAWSNRFSKCLTLVVVSLEAVGSGAAMITTPIFRPKIYKLP